MGSQWRLERRGGRARRSAGGRGPGVVRGHRPVPLRSPRPHRRHRAPLPMIGGHEGAGIVQEVGPGVGTEGRRPRGGVVPAGVRSLPLVCERSSEPVRPGRDASWSAPSSTALTGGMPGAATSAPCCCGHVRAVRHACPRLVGEDRRRPAAVAGLPARLRGHHRMGLGGQHRRRQARRHRRGDRLRRHRQRRDPGRAAGRRGEDHRGRIVESKRDKAFPVRRHAFRHLDARGHRAGCRVDHVA